MEVKENKATSVTGLGLVFGVAIGAGLGIIFDNLAIGAGIGIVIGAIIDSYKNKK